jgi:hypothetical protein
MVAHICNPSYLGGRDRRMETLSQKQVGCGDTHREGGGKRISFQGLGTKPYLKN